MRVDAPNRTTEDIAFIKKNLTAQIEFLQDIVWKGNSSKNTLDHWKERRCEPDWEVGEREGHEKNIVYGEEARQVIYFLYFTVKKMQKLLPLERDL